MHSRSTAFTLIELLVVITIIVVLLALLVPALDKAIYRAELTMCAANQRSVVQGVVTYAAENQRHYPQRNFRLQTFRLAQGTGAADDRKRLQPYMGLKMLLCPLDGGIDLNASANDEDTVVFANYGMWWNWKAAGAGLKAMNRIGDRWEFDLEGERVPFRLLIDDQETLDDNHGNHYATHPDRDGMLSQFIHQNGEWVAQIAGTQVLSFKMTISFWRTFQTPNPRGPMDRNFGLDDGSVQLIEGLTVPEVGQTYDRDGELVRVSTWADNTDYAISRTYVVKD